MTCKDILSKFFWFGFGLWFKFPQYVVIWIASEDILAGSLQATSSVLIAFGVSDFLSKAVISPWLVDRISFLPAFIAHALMFLAIVLTFVFVNIVNVRLAGLFFLGFTNGLGSITAVKLLGFYSESTQVYQSGVHFASAFASIFYTGLTTWVCVSPRIAFVILTPFCLLPLVLYALLDKERLKGKKTSTKGITYQPLNNEENSELKSVTQTGNKKLVSNGLQLKPFFNLFIVIYYFGMVSYLFQLTLTSILPVLTFQSSPFPPRDHYQYYRFITDLGQMLGGMEVSLVSVFFPRFLDTVKIRRIWILMLLDVGHVLLLLSISWFHYTDNVYMILILCFTLGVATGCVQVHSYCLAADFYTDPKKLGKVLGYMEVGVSVARSIAGLLGLFVEKYLREHCEHHLLLGRFCLARFSSHVMWSTSNC